MSFTKPTISHQLKSVRSECTNKKTSVVHGNTNICLDSSHMRSHLRQNIIKKKPIQNIVNDKVCNVLTDSDIKQCTKLLRNVLTSEALLYKYVDTPKKNKSTSTDDFNNENGIEHNRSSILKQSDSQTHWKSYTKHNSTIDSKTHQKISDQKIPNRSDIDKNRSFLEFDDQTDAESLITEPAPPIAHSTQKPNKRSSSEVTYCHCNQLSMNNSTINNLKSNMTSCEDNQKLLIDYSSGDTRPICCRCHNIIPANKEISMSRNYKKGDESPLHYNKSSPIMNNNTYTDVKYRGNIEKSMSYSEMKLYGQQSSISPLLQYEQSQNSNEKIDNLTTYLHARFIDMKAIAKSTRDADLDRLISDVEQAFQLIIRENGLVFSTMKNNIKILSKDNASYKLKIKNQNQLLNELKAELKLVRQDHKQKMEELKLELELKNEELKQLTETEAHQNQQMRDKYQKLEKELERIKNEYQEKQIKQCQKEKEIIQLKQNHLQLESKYKEKISQLTRNLEKCQNDLAISQHTLTQQESEIHHAQSVIKAARYQVVGLLERHRVGTQLQQQSLVTTSDQTTTTSKTTPINQATQSVNTETHDWVQQAASLHRVLSMANVKPNNLSKAQYSSTSQINSKHYYPINNNNQCTSPINIASMNEDANQSNPQIYSNSISVSSVGLMCDNNNNHHTSTLSQYDTLQNKMPITTKQSIDDKLNCASIITSPTMFDTITPTNNTQADQQDDLNSQVDHQQFSNRSSVDLDHDFGNEEFDRDLSFTTHDDPTTIQQQLNQNNKQVIDPWQQLSINKTNRITRCSSSITATSSAGLSTVSSLRSTDDVEFRTGIQRLDGQICRLQSTLRTKLNRYQK